METWRWPNSRRCSEGLSDSHMVRPVKLTQSCQLAEVIIIASLQVAIGTAWVSMDGPTTGWCYRLFCQVPYPVRILT